MKDYRRILRSQKNHEDIIQESEDHEQGEINMVEDYEEPKKISLLWQSIIDEDGAQVFDDDKLIDDLNYNAHVYSDDSIYKKPMHISKSSRDCVRDESIIAKLDCLNLERHTKETDDEIQADINREWDRLEAKFRMARNQLRKRQQNLIIESVRDRSSRKLVNHASESTSKALRSETVSMSAEAPVGGTSRQKYIPSAQMKKNMDIKLRLMMISNILISVITAIE